jgi:hypothetical protein
MRSLWTLLAVTIGLSTGCAHGIFRAPSTASPSVVESSLVQKETDLRSLYPELSDAAFQRKLDGATTPLRFLRSFAPAYFQSYSRQKVSFSDTLRTAARFQGWCAGDAHPENFGTRLNDSGKAVFTLVDLDDFGRCSLIADILHFLLATRLATPELADRDSLQAIVAAYLNGSEGRVKLSKPVRTLLERAEDRTYFDEDIEPHRQDDQEPTSTIGRAERDELAAALSKAFSKVSVSKAVRYAKIRGGSAGLTRYRAQLDSDEGPVVLELRTLVRPATAFEGLESPEPRVRLETALRMTSPQGCSKWYRVQKLGDRWMLISPRYKGTRAVDLKLDTAGDSDDMLKLVRDEAAVLGELHSRGAERFATYLTAVRALKPQDWEAALDSIASELEQIRRRAAALDRSGK